MSLRTIFWRSAGLILAVCSIFGFSFQTIAAVDPANFAGADGKLNKAELTEYLLVQGKIGYDEIDGAKVTATDIADAGGDEFQAKKYRLLKLRLLEVKSLFGDGPYDTHRIKKLVEERMVHDLEEMPRKKEDSVGNRWAGVFLKPKITDTGTGSYGPFRLREKYEDWNKKDINKVKGASLNFKDDRESDKQSWLSKGSLTYPLLLKRQDGARTFWSEYAILPTIRWDYLTVNDAGDSDKQALAFKLPLSAVLSHRREPGGEDGPPKTALISEMYLTPFYLTDFDFGGAIAGVELKYEPTLSLAGTFRTGSWSHVPFAKKTSAAYLLRFIPGFTYNQVIEESNFVEREKNDDMTALTADISIALKPFGAKIGWDLRGGYKLVYDFNTSGDEDAYTDMWTAGIGYWFTQFIGFIVEFEQGIKALTKKKTDLITAGFQVRM